MRRFRWALPLAVLLLAASALAGVAQPRFARSAETPAAKTITVSGHGTVTTVPDRAGFDFTVETRAATAAAALAKNADAAAAVVQAAKAAGVAAADLQTSQVSLSPQTSPDGTTILGYIASTSVSTTIAIPKAGALVDAAVRAGADNVSGPYLSRSDEDALYNDALKSAVANAKQKAAALAAAGGLSLGGVQTIVEGSAAPVPLPFAGAKAADGTVSIEPGSQTIDATVTVTFAAS
jgi:uncharacterized protein